MKLRQLAVKWGWKWVLAFIVVVGAWLNMGSYYINRVPWPYYEHDSPSHLEYSQILAREKVFPTPFRSWETYQPPLYYVVDQLASPLAKGHTFTVRWYSVAYGTLVLLMLLVLMAGWGVGPEMATLASLFLLTTPAFVQLFTSYNNDSLAMFFSVAAVFSLWKYWRTQRWPWLILIFLVTGLGAYAKYTSVYTSLVLLLFIGVGYLVRFAPRPLLIRIGIALVLGVATLFPWLQFHNKAETGQYLPQNAQGENLGPVMEAARMRNNGGILRFLLTPPGISDGEWATPFAIEQYRDGTGQFRWTKKNLASSVLTTSAIGEFEYSTVPEGSRFITYAWLAIWAQLFTVVVIWKYYRREMGLLVVLCGLALIALACHLIFVHQFLNDANYRYFAWTSVPYFVAFALALEKARQGHRRQQLVLFGIATGFILAHLAFYHYLII